jgi:hypothetical protein
MKKIDLSKIDWSTIQEKHSEGIHWNNLPKMFNISKTILERALIGGYLEKKIHVRIMSSDAKKKH